MTENNSIIVHGITCYRALPEGWRLAVLDDFHYQGKVKEGIQFLLFGTEQKLYECYTVRPDLTAREIKRFIDDGRVFIKCPENLYLV